MALISAAVLSVSMLPTWAEDAPMAEMDHSTMSGMDHSKKTDKEKTKAETMDHDHSKMDGMDHSKMKGMDHGSMESMQGGSAPADARDPHANSGGYSIESGQYALPGPRILKLADEYNFGMLLIDRFETVRTSDNTSSVYDLQAWYGRDYDRLVFKAEGDVDDGTLEEATTELLWGHAIATFWDTQLGVRYDNGEGPDRNWLAFGVQGLAPYWFEVDITGYIGENGRSALSLEAEYEVLITQKLIFQPRIEAEVYGKDDLQRGIGSGLSEVALGFRLRYEFVREFGPYVGVEWASKYGNTADIARAADQDTSETRAVAGVRFWF
ncbi:MAG: copper resistance protein B [Ectothiorhodospiraceae bacterium]|nr:copper resistance protein B [Ectothiorhodospiraceae bacterium]